MSETMSLRGALRRCHESGDFGRALEGYSEAAEELESALAAARKALERCQKLERLAALLGAAWFYGGFKAETANEREQEILMEDLGYVFGSENELIAAINGDSHETNGGSHEQEA